MSKRSFAIWTAYWAVWAFFGLVEFYTQAPGVMGGSKDKAS